jgi:predicted dehydrogenase
MGRRHIEVVLSLGLDLVGVFDKAPAALEQAAAEYHLVPSQLFDDLHALLARRPEAVVVATTSPSHADFTCLAAECGARFILCEKPLATSLQACDRALSVCRRFGVRLAVNHQMRFMEQYTVPREMLLSPAFGGLSGVTVTAGNFGLAMNGTHYFEMFRYLAGEPAVEVAAWFSPDVVPNPRGPEFVDRAGCVRLVTPSGKRFYLDCSADQGHGLQVVYAGRLGHIFVDELRGTMTWACRKEEHRGLPTTRYGMPYDCGERAIKPADSTAPTRSVLQALLRGENYPTGEDGRLAVATLVAAHVSAEHGGRPVRLADAETQAERVFPWA